MLQASKHKILQFYGFDTSSCSSSCVMESTPINKGNNKKSLFTCFKPDMEAVDDDGDSFKHARKRQKSNGNSDPVLAYLSSADECGNRHRKKGRGIWNSLRKALNDTTSVKKIIKRWKTRKENMSRSNNHTEPKTIHKQNTTHKTNSNSSSTLGGNSSSAIFTPSSSLSSTSSSSSHADHVSRSSSQEINSPPLNGTSKQNSVEDGRKRKRKCGSNKALCLLSIISLLVLILWGKFFAILCTSVWFYLMPLNRRRQLKEKVSCVEENNEFDSVQYKKKVIMEGMLERKHSHVSLASMSKS